MFIEPQAKRSTIEICRVMNRETLTQWSMRIAAVKTEEAARRDKTKCSITITVNTGAMAGRSRSRRRSRSTG